MYGCHNVHGEARDRRRSWTEVSSTPILDRPLHDPIDLVQGELELPSDRTDIRFSQPVDRDGLEGRSEARPGSPQGMATCRTPCASQLIPRDLRDDRRPVLARVQMPPPALASIVVTIKLVARRRLRPNVSTNTSISARLAFTSTPVTFHGSIKPRTVAYRASWSGELRVVPHALSPVREHESSSVRARRVSPHALCRARIEAVAMAAQWGQLQVRLRDLGVSRAGCGRRTARSKRRTKRLRQSFPAGRRPGARGSMRIHMGTGACAELALRNGAKRALQTCRNTRIAEPIRYRRRRETLGISVSQEPSPPAGSRRCGL